MQSVYSTSQHSDNRLEESGPAEGAQTSGYGPGKFVSTAPSAGWSTSSPAASWGSSHTAAEGQTWSSHQPGASSDQSVLQKAKEHLPGQAGLTTEQSRQESSSQQSLLDRAKDYLPGSSTSHPAGLASHSEAGQVQERGELPDVPVVSTWLSVLWHYSGDVQLEETLLQCICAKACVRSHHR